jgi:hypothetical protein
MVLPCPAGIAIFSGAQLQHGFPIGFLKILQLPLILFADIFWLGAERVLHPRFTLIDPFLDLRGCQIIRPCRLGNRRLALNNLKDQRALPPRRPSLYVFIHDHAHMSLSSL